VRPDATPLFFVSYARSASDDDSRVQRFFGDLSHEVEALSGTRRAGVGFLDAAAPAGERWSAALVDALSRCQVFIALASPRYFTSSWCGREWAAFERRLARAERRTGRPASALIPLSWVPSPMPAVATRYQQVDRALGEAYGRYGLRDLIGRADRDDAYHGFVHALARRIVSVADESAVPPEPERPDLETIPPAFPDRPPADIGSSGGPARLTGRAVVFRTVSGPSLAGDPGHAGSQPRGAPRSQATGAGAGQGVPGRSGLGAGQAVPGRAGAVAGQAVPGRSGAGADRAVPGRPGTQTGPDSIDIDAYLETDDPAAAGPVLTALDRIAGLLGYEGPIEERWVR
jgi:hypothetical protein